MFRPLADQDGSSLKMHRRICSSSRKDSFSLIVFLPLLLSQRVVLQQRGVAADGRQRGLEFMGDIGDKVSVQRLGAVQLPNHLIKAVP